MVDTALFYENLIKNQIEFFTGVPDSLLKDFCAYIKDNSPSENNIIAANEGNSVGIATGYYLATGKIPLVYMQNSGLGNVINPLTSLTDKLVYGIPMILLIGWRGEPGVKDEPQHKKQGIITKELIEVLGVKYEVLSEDTSNEEAEKMIKRLHSYAKENKETVALIAKKKTFTEYKLINNANSNFELSREEAIEVLLSKIDENSVIVSTTGMASRELFEIREKRKESHEKDFLTVGSMGHASQIALGIALNNKDKDVYCIDGDGALLMHLGGLAIIGSQSCENFKHIVINNGAHDSVGGQDTVALNLDFKQVAISLGYKKAYRCETMYELEEISKEIKNINGPIFLEILVRKGARKDLGRPTTTPVQNKDAFMEFLK